MQNYLAFDLGAESGRAILGRLAPDGTLTLEELHRFLNQPVRLPNGLYWDSFRLFHDIREGLRIAGRERKLALAGVAVDTWGVDFGLLDANGDLVDNPRCYRDPRTNGLVERACAQVGQQRIWQETGCQFMQLNSLYQFWAARLANAPCLGVARHLLFMPDLLSYWLSGVMKNELTIASTSQFYHPAQRAWSTALLRDFDLPANILGEIVPPGARLGGLLPEIAQFAALGDTPVYATASHDTASAVAAVPAAGDRNWCYISSGTWSLMGLEIDEPILTPRALELTLTNEVGAEGKIRLLKNIAGLWLVQECRRAWMLAGREYSYAELADLAAAAPPLACVINPDAFLEPGDMPARLAAHAQSTGQTLPADPGGIVRTILESLALRYQVVLGYLESLTGTRVDVIHIVGGGSKNRLLNQLVADCTGREVVAGPGEATAIGNILVQAMGAGRLRGLADVRAVVRQSFELETYTPRPAAGWQRAAEKFAAVTAPRAK